jgi:uncharacterized protein (DUF58 family)
MTGRLRSWYKNMPHLTFTGYNFLLITVVVWFFSFYTQNRIVTGAFTVLAASVIASYFASLYSLHGLSIKRFLKGSFTAGDLFVMEYEIENKKLFFPVFHMLITDCCANSVFKNTYYHFKAEVGIIPPGGKSFATCTGRIKERGVLEFDLIRVNTRFPFGIFYSIREFSVPDTIESYPRYRNIRPRALFAGEVTGYSELPSDRWEKGYDIFKGIREYRRGDKLKWIDWKSSAKYRDQLRVREYSTTEEKEIFVIFDPAAGWISRKNKNIKFEISLVYAVSLIKFFLDKGNQITFYTMDGTFTEISKVQKFRDFKKILSVAAGVREKKGINFHKDVERRSKLIKQSGAGVIIIGAGIQALYKDMFKGYNIKIVDVAEQNIRSMFFQSKIVV